MGYQIALLNFLQNIAEVWFTFAQKISDEIMAEIDMEGK
jgi:hypothetical protein